MARMSKGEYRENSEEKKRVTQDALQEHEKLSQEAGSAVEAFNDAAGGEILLTETADELNSLGAELEQEIAEQSRQQQEVVESHVEIERSEVSDPARQAETSGQEAVQKLEAAENQAEHFSDGLKRSEEVYREIERFFGETATDSEEHQAESKDQTRTADEAARAAAHRRTKV